MKIELYSDGSCLGTPGPGGWGSYISIDNKSHEIHLYGGSYSTTNNRMELSGAIEGLNHLLSYDDYSDFEVVVLTDSQYVKNGIETWIKNWKKNGWKTSNRKPVVNQDLWQILDKLNESKKFKSLRFSWVKGHAGNYGNEQADCLASNGSKLASQLTKDGSFASMI